MILVRAPLRISFVGGGTDLPGFYRHSPGRVLSATIDKFVYLAIKSTPLVNKFIIKYQKTEVASHPRELEHDRAREALLNLGLVNEGIEIGSFADLPAKTGLGSSSSFSVALMKGLHAFQGGKLSNIQAAALACDLEINLLKEPIGKQDQYAAACGGFNIFQFNSNESVSVEPILLDFRKRALLEDHIMLFFTGIARPASSVLKEQSSKVLDNFETYKKMSDSVLEFKDKLLAGDIKSMAGILNDGWKMKKSLAANVSSALIDELFETGINAGAWGGKILG
ncbi:MAG: GHMP kinase, partial [Candidatus Giovannonibacteria bacterium]|nr:GHMP kinase [Candidatus Giovannonibacteria bacterium]